MYRPLSFIIAEFKFEKAVRERYSRKGAVARLFLKPETGNVKVSAVLQKKRELKIVEKTM